MHFTFQCHMPERNENWHRMKARIWNASLHVMVRGGPKKKNLKQEDEVLITYYMRSLDRQVM